MGWRGVEEVVCDRTREVVIRLKQGNDLPVQLLGLSVHQVAIVTSSGDMFCIGKKLKPEWVEGWMELPPPNRENQ